MSCRREAYSDMQGEVNVRMAENVLSAKMLGGFSVYYEGREIALDRNTTSKSMQLLQILLMNIEAGGIAKTSLADALYGREEVENKNGSLNNTIFRLKKQLKAAGFPEANYVVIKRGMCRWENETIPVQVDAIEFERLIEKGKQERDPEAKTEAYLAACRLYTGEFLPNMIGEDWVAVRNVHYQELYEESLRQLFGWLQAEERYEEIYQLATTAAGIYPFNDWALWQIDSLIAMSRFREAMAIYEKVTKLFFDELGLPPSPEMLDRARLMAERISQSSGVIHDIKQRISERQKMPGAYYCTYPSFVDIYHVVSRMMERNGMSVYLMLCTLKHEGSDMGSEEREQNVSKALRDSIMGVLRRGDFYTRYNTKQYLVMLPEINQENCAKVSARIDRAFSKKVRRSDFHVDYYVASVVEIDEDAAGEKPKFRNSGPAWGSPGEKESNGEVS